ncbi:hypothetical protein C8F01DRAFT_1101900 [Mycena amicta]|nr:hypothetical protein C8F01DRAFT_1101900 [Mycena amicta]
MAQPDGFSKLLPSKPTSRPPVPKFTSAFDGIDTSTPDTEASKPSKFPEQHSTRRRTSTVLPSFNKPAVLNGPTVAPQEHKLIKRALKPPIPLFNLNAGPTTSSPPRQRPPPPLPVPTPPLQYAAFRHLKLDPPPIPLTPAGPSKPTVALKPLVPPQRPAPVTTIPADKMRTISTTMLARTTDIFTESGPAELASLLLDQYMEVDEWTTPDDLEERRGLIISPEKASGKGKEKEKFVRGGLAAWAKAFYERQQSARSLWEAETIHSISSISSRRASLLSLIPDMRLRIKHILRIPQLSSHQKPKPDVSIPGIALCHIIAGPSAATSDPYQAPLPLSKDSVCSVLLSFASISPPRTTTSTLSATLRNAEDFAEGREVYVWRPWQTLVLDVAMLQTALDKVEVADSPAARARATGSDDLYELFGPTAARARHREKIVPTGLLCDRFVILR